MIFDILGLKDEAESTIDEKLTDDLIKIIVELRQDARNNKDFNTSDRIRQELKKAGVILKDLKDGVRMGEGVAFETGQKPPMIPPRGDKRLHFNDLGR